MKKIKIGKGNKKVLLIHGWMSSSKIYMRFAKDLEKECDITLIDLPGFGEEKFSKELLKGNNFFEFYKLGILKLLEKEKFDIIIGHSLGGNLILRALDSLKNEFDGKVILLNPCYNGIKFLRFIAILTLINRLLFRLKSLLPRWIAKPFIKLFSLLSINKWSLIDDMIIDDVRVADPYVAYKVMNELVFDKWRFKNKNNIRNITIIKGEKDRLIKEEKINILMKDIRECRLVKLRNTGHTTIVEDYDKFIKIFKDEAEKIN